MGLVCWWTSREVSVAGEQRARRKSQREPGGRVVGDEVSKAAALGTSWAIRRIREPLEVFEQRSDCI